MQVKTLALSSQELLNHGKQTATDSLKSVSARAIQKTAEATVSFMDNKIAHKSYYSLKNFTKE